MQSTDVAVGIMFYSKEGHRQLIININKFHFLRGTILTASIICRDPRLLK